MARKEAMRRRGMVLLIVLSLLMLFAIMTITFVVISGHFRAGAASYLRQRRGDDEPRRQSDRVVYTLLRDTDDFMSVMRGHSFLRDLYGDDGLKGRIAVGGGAPLPMALLNGEILELPVQVTVGTPEDIAGFYNGCVLTLTTGRAKGTSLRVVGYRYDPTGGVPFPTFRVLVPTGDYAPPNLVGLLSADLTANVLIEVIVNGRPFSGEGFGFYGDDTSAPALNINPPTNPITGLGGYTGTWKLDRPHPGPDNGWGRAGIDDNNDSSIDEPAEWMWPGSDDSWACLLPNHFQIGNNDIRVRGYSQGGGDEDYDTYDLQNMALGAVIYEAPEYGRPVHIEPSFHRTSLVNFWFNWIDETWLKPIGVPDFVSPYPEYNSKIRLGIFLQPFGPNNYPPGHPKNVPADEHTFFQTNPQYNWVLTQIANVKRMIMMRPLPEFNPNFTGSNDALAAAYSTLEGTETTAEHIYSPPPAPPSLGTVSVTSGVRYLNNPFVYGPFDVDNDLDGVPDSIWMDVALPVRAGPTGRVAKPLIAMLAVDLDGRFNLNAHGFPVAGPWPVSQAPQALAGGGLATSLPYGSGYGPPEVNLSYLFSSNASIAASQTMSLLFGNGMGRYGQDQVPGAAGTELIATNKFQEYPLNYFNTNYHVGYETPPDLWGELQMGLDVRGCPTYTTPNTGRVLLADHPFELNFSPKVVSGAAPQTNRDRLFDLGELDSILRRNEMTSGDVASGAGTQGRLSKLVQAFSDMPVTVPQIPNQSNANRTLVSTHSVDIPVPNIPRPADWQGRRFKHISELFKERVRDRYNNATGYSHKLVASGATPPPPFDFDATTFGYNDNLQDPLVAAHVAALTSPELIMGLRLDVNRPFGNNHDDNGNGVIDEHWQISNFIYNEAYKGNANDERINQNGAPTDPDNDGVIALDSDAFIVRQILARHLYVLMMAMKPRTYHFSGSVTNTAADDEADAKVIAQWAINAVDFRDADSIMTPFEYDIDPFEPHPGVDGAWGTISVDDNSDGTTDDIREALARGSDDRLWSVDGILDDGTGTISADDTGNPRRRIVWGCERPEALINETFAWHDVKQEDMDVNGLVGDPVQEDGPNMPGSDDLDQRYQPKGGAMIEIYNPWGGRADRVPAELYSGPSLQLDKVVSYLGSPTDPVWRILITRNDAADTTDDSPDTQYPNNAGGTGTPEYEHATDVVYFATGLASPPAVTNTADGSTATVHMPPVDIAPLPPGRYAVVGTYRGAPADLVDPNTGATDGAADEYVVTIGHDKDQTGNLLSADASRRIVLHPNPDSSLNWTAVELNANGTVPGTAPNMGSDNIETPPVRLWPEPNPPYPALPSNYGPATIHPAVAIPILNFNFSEHTYPAVDAMGNPAVVLANGDVEYTAEYDIPFDNAGSGNQDPDGDAALLESNGTKVGYRKAHLQRLANPLLPYNQFTNPYLTIDMMPIDLHVFNGSSDTGTTYDTDMVRDFTEPTFTTRERGTLAEGIWRTNLSTTPRPALTTPVTLSNHSFVFDQDLQHSIGYLNTTLSGSRLQWDYAMPPNSSTTTDKYYVGVSGTGFVSPWLSWNNRPYVSQYEMLLVPKTSSMDLLKVFSPRQEVEAGSSTEVSPYYPHEEDPAIIAAGAVGPRGPAVRGPYHHLLNFFGTTHQFVTSSGAIVTQQGPDLYNLFEMTGVPSRFVGTETWLDGTTFSTNAAGTEYLHPPFNRVHNFREFGKVNFNTILSLSTPRAEQSGSPGAAANAFDFHIPWNASLVNAIIGENHSLPTTLPDIATTTISAADRLMRSRRGGNAALSTLGGRINLLGTNPSLVGNPLRSGDGGSLVPITAQSAALLATRPITGPLAPLLQMERPPIETSMLRSERIAPVITPPDTLPPSTTPNQWEPLFAESNAAAHRQTDENAMFRYRQLTRLPNLITTRSNVYAVWVTIGYFEVDPQTGQLGQEVGSDGGKIERHRAFYIVDRSIPVAFESGKDHNIERAILLRRYME